MGYLGLALLLLGLAAALPTAAQAQLTCNVFSGISLSQSFPFMVPGDAFTVGTDITTGTIGGGTGSASINRFRWEHDCDPANATFIGCTSVDTPVNYAGDASLVVGTGCVDINSTQLFVISDFPAGGNVLGQVTFTFVNNLIDLTPTPLFMASGDISPCSVVWDASVAARDQNDATTTVLETVIGFIGTDAECSIGTASTGSQSALVQLCPICDDELACNGIETCNQDTGLCEPGTPVTCDDLNACTTEVCNPGTGQCETTNTVTCNDGNACTTEACNPATGQCEAGTPVTCDDGNACTTEACNPATGQCEAGTPVNCDDNNACTVDACNPATGLCTNTPEDPLPSECTPPFCGNGIIDPGEQCDDGNSNNRDRCRNDCTRPICGDGIKDANEQCDDGNANNLDACSNDCTVSRAIPTLSEWGQLGLALILTGGAGWYLRRRRTGRAD